MAHGTCRRVKACNNFRTFTKVKRWGPLISNSQITRLLPQLKIVGHVLLRAMQRVPNGAK